MEFRRVWVLRGANAWARAPVFEVELAVGPAQAPAGFGERLAALLGQDSPAELRGVTGLDRALQLVSLRLQCLAGSEVAFGLTRPAGTPGLFRVVFEYEEEALARPCLEA